MHLTNQIWQSNLFDWPEPLSYPQSPGSKAFGPSQEAARRIAPMATTARRNVLEHYVDNFPRAFTADETAEILKFSILTIRPRVAELHKAGLIEPVPIRRKNASGMLATCWRASRDGLAEVHND